MGSHDLARCLAPNASWGMLGRGRPWANHHFMHPNSDRISDGDTLIKRRRTHDLGREGKHRGQRLRADGQYMVGGLPRYLQVLCSLHKTGWYPSTVKIDRHMDDIHHGATPSQQKLKLFVSYPTHENKSDAPPDRRVSALERG